MRFQKSVFVFFLTFYAHFIEAQQKINYASDSLKAKRKNSFLITPLLGYQQETRFAFGIASVYVFRTNKQDSLLRTSTIPTGILYTQNDQIIIGLGGNIFLPKEKYNIKFENTFSKFPDKFWGIGNNTKDPHEAYTFTQFYINPQLHRKIWDNFFLGIGWDMQRVYNIGYVDSGYFVRDKVLGVFGKSEYFISGLGTYYTYDSRNHAYCPDKGMLLRLKFNIYQDFFGSNYNFEVMEIDFRKFIKTTPNQVLAIHSLGTFTFGDVPFRSMATLGGNSIMRGYYQGRYRDKMFIGTQLEYRFPLFWRFGGVGFAAIGQVMENLRQFSFLEFKAAFGAGLRVALIPKEKLNLRIDLGVTDKFSFQPYVTVTESF